MGLCDHILISDQMDFMLFFAWGLDRGYTYFRFKSLFERSSITINQALSDTDLYLSFM